MPRKYIQVTNDDLVSQVERIRDEQAKATGVRPSAAGVLTTLAFEAVKARASKSKKK